MALEEVSTDRIEQWLSSLGGAASSRTKALVLLHGILKRARKVWGLEANAAAEVEKPALVRSGDIQVFSPEEVWSLVRAGASQLDAGIYLTAAFTGLRLGELLALRWRDVDFVGAVIRVRASYAAGARTTPKSGKVRAVPMAPDVATALAQLGQREDWVGEDDLVFVGVAGGYLDGSALRRRYKAALAAAGLRPLRFHEYADVRDADDREGGHSSGAGVDGARGYPGHDALPALRAARRGRGPGCEGVRATRGGAGPSSGRPMRRRRLWRFAGTCPKMSQDVPHLDVEGHRGGSHEGANPE